MSAQEQLEVLQLAAIALDRRIIKIRNLGVCKTCGTHTSSGMNHFCPDCAVDVIYRYVKANRKHEEKHV